MLTFHEFWILDLTGLFWFFKQYRQAYTGNNSSQIQAAMKGFEEVIKKFPRCAEGYALYAQVNVIFHTFLVASPFFLKIWLVCWIPVEKSENNALFLLRFSGAPRVVPGPFKRGSYVTQFENHDPKLIMWGSVSRTSPLCFYLDWIYQINLGKFTIFNWKRKCLWKPFVSIWSLSF